MSLLRSFSWKGMLAFFGFATALALWTWCGIVFSNKVLTFGDHLSYFLELLQRNLLNYFPAFLLVGVADGLPLRGRIRVVALAAALAIGIALSVQVRCAVNMNEIYWAYDSVQIPYCTTWPTWRTYLDFPGAYITPFCIAGVVMVFVFTRRRDNELVASLHQAQAAALDVRRQRVESELAAMQSRVDPDRLLNTLRTVRARYETNLHEGEAMLDTLIGDLRHAAHAPQAT
jgi:hypothetical protein